MSDPNLALYKVNQQYKQSQELLAELQGHLSHEYSGISSLAPPTVQDKVQIQQNNTIIVLLIDIINILQEQNNLL